MAAPISSSPEISPVHSETYSSPCFNPIHTCIESSYNRISPTIGHSSAWLVERFTDRIPGNEDKEIMKEYKGVPRARCGSFGGCPSRRHHESSRYRMLPPRQSRGKLLL